LIIRLEKYQTEITRFTEDFEVPFDNNQAERDIRNQKVHGKVTGGFRTNDGAEDYVRTTSVIGTIVKFGRNVVDNVCSAFQGNLLVFEAV
jgi:transposase